jgi:hypothetical protein
VAGSRAGGPPGVRSAVVGLAMAVMALAGCTGNAAKSATTTITTTVPPETTTTAEAPLTAGRQISFYVPAVGDCFDIRTADKGPPIYLKLDCSIPHQNEVFATIEFTLKDYPGEPFLRDGAKQTCPKSWEAYVGKPFETSSFELGYLLPDEATWGNGIRHTTGCLIQPGSGERMVGSAKGSGQ